MAARASEKPLVTEYTSRSSLIEHCLTSVSLGTDSNSPILVLHFK
jgi:hypothetical protein